MKMYLCARMCKDVERIRGITIRKELLAIATIGIAKKRELGRRVISFRRIGKNINERGTKDQHSNYCSIVQLLKC